MRWKDKPLADIIDKVIKSGLLSQTSKIEKSKAFGWHVYGLQLLPFNLAGGGNLCPSSTDECRKLCIYQAGNARFKTVNQARYDRTKLFLNARDQFIDLINAELIRLNVLSKSTGYRIAVRLNMFSDIGWEKFIDMNSYPYIQFYDYTKVQTRMIKFMQGKFAPNYHLTFSYDGNDFKFAKTVLELGFNTSVVFQTVPTEYQGYKVVNGDEHDLTFIQEKGTIIGLKYKKPISKQSIKSNNFVVK